MRALVLVILAVVALLSSPRSAMAQGAAGDRLIVATVTRPPFSLVQDGVDTGFSLDLWAEVANELNLLYDIRRYDTFPDMLRAVQEGEANAAVANISITAEREMVMDFTQPIFSAGIQIVLPAESGSGAALRAVLSPRLFLLAFAGIAGLLILGMLMWLLERRRHDYFGPSARDAAFPAFWWALNLLISGDYREKTPVSPLGRLFGVLMIVGSLFVVSLFVANITATLTLDALSQDIERITDLDERRVGTTEGSTTSAYLETRGVGHLDYADLEELLTAFEEREIDAVAFDGPILAYYVETRGKGSARLLDRVFQREYYGIALPTGSALREPINQTLLRLEEEDAYNDILRKWFGASYSFR